MKVLVLVLVLFSPVAWGELVANAAAGAYVVEWDPNPSGDNVIEYVVYLDGVEHTRTAETTVEIDRATEADRVTVAARNEEGLSEQSAPAYFPHAPTRPGRLRITVTTTTTVETQK